MSPPILPTQSWESSRNSFPSSRVGLGWIHPNCDLLGQFEVSDANSGVMQVQEHNLYVTVEPL